MTYLCKIKRRTVMIDHNYKVVVTDDVPQFARNVALLTCSDNENAYAVAKKYIKKRLKLNSDYEYIDENGFSVAVVNLDANPRFPKREVKIDIYTIDLTGVITSESGGKYD